MPRLVRRIRAQYPRADDARVADFEREYRSVLGEILDHPQHFGRADILTLCEQQQALLRKHGFDDPYLDIKTRENAAALAALPAVLRELDAAEPQREVELLARGLLAGNLFDLGAAITAERYHNGSHDFWRSRAELPPRPWFIDDLDAWAVRWRTGAAYRHAAFFVDNAGWDICLGCLPLARWMVRRGTRVSLAANSHAALNDITATELVQLVSGEAVVDDEIARAVSEGWLRIVPTGSGTPLLDLKALSPQCVAALADADLVMLHGMGRSLESNRTAEFTCDVLRTAVVKDPLVAAHVGAKLMDCVFRFTPV